jgi:hypothetical protein
MYQYLPISQLNLQIILLRWNYQPFAGGKKAQFKQLVKNPIAGSLPNALYYTIYISSHHLDLREYVNSDIRLIGLAFISV